MTAPPSRRGPRSTIAGLMIGIAIFGVAIRLYRKAPFSAVFLLVCMAPALSITEVAARGRRRRGDPMTAGERIAWVVAWTIPVIVALEIAVFVYYLHLSVR